MEKVKKNVKIEKYIFKTKACDSFSLAPMERAPQNYSQKCVNSKSPKIELDCFTKPGPHAIFFSVLQYSIAHTNLAPRQSFNTTRT